MIKNLTKSEYYREKKIPQVTICRRLEPQPSVRTHLIDSLPKFSTEFEKIRSQLNCQNKVNLELANALKIIHELEYELEIMTSKCTENQEELLQHRNSKKQYERQRYRLEQKIAYLENTIQKNEFTARSKFQSDKQHYYSIIASYEKRIEDMNGAYEKLKNDREKELENAKRFHQGNISKAQIQIKQIENTSQVDINNFKNELSKAIKENSIMRQRITDLQTCNQQHIRELQRSNEELIHTIQTIRGQSSHKITILQTELDLAHNKIKQLYDQIGSWDNRFSKQSKIWLQQKLTFDRKYLDNEASWKSNYNQIIKQKQKTIQQLNVKTIQLGEKDKQIVNLTNKIRTIQRQLTQLLEQKTKIIQNSDKAKKQMKDNLQLDHLAKTNNLTMEYERNLNQQVYKAIDNERKQLEEKYKIQILKYVDKIRILQQTKLNSSHQVRLVEEDKRKLQAIIEQIKVQGQYVKKSHRQQINSLKIQINQLVFEHQQSSKAKHNQYLNQLERIKNDMRNVNEQLKQKYELIIKDLQQDNDNKSWQLEEAKTKVKKLTQLYENERSTFISRVQSFEVTIGRMKNSNDQLTKGNKQLLEKVQSYQIAYEKYNRSQQETQQIIKKLRQEIDRQVKKYSQLKFQLQTEITKQSQSCKTLQNEVFNYKKKESQFKSEISSLVKKVSQFQNRYIISQQQVKKLESQKIQLQKRISQNDVNFKQKWQNIETNFTKINQKLAAQGEARQKQLKNEISEKLFIIANLNKRVEECQVILAQERKQSQNNVINWQIRYKQIEQNNKKLSKQFVNLQNLYKQTSQKQVNLKVLQKQVQKYIKQIEMRNKEKQQLQNKVIDYEIQINYFKAQKVVSVNQISRLQSTNNDMKKSFDMLRLTAEREKQNKMKQIQHKGFQFTKLQSQLANALQRLQQQQRCHQKTKQEKKKISQQIFELEALIQTQRIQLLNNTEKIESTIIALKNQKASLATQLKNLKQRFKQYELETNETLTIKNRQIQDLAKRVVAYEKGLISLKNTYQEQIKKHQLQKNNSNSLKQKLLLKQNQNENLKKLNIKITQQAQALQSQNKKNDDHVIKIYQQFQKRLNLARKQAEDFYLHTISMKDKQMETMKNRIETMIQQQKAKSKQFQLKINEQKQLKQQQIHQKSIIITTITDKYKDLQIKYNTSEAELAIYKRKWNAVFCQVNVENKQINQFTIQANNQKTVEKKVIRQYTEVKNEKTQKIVTIGSESSSSAISNSINSSLVNQNFKQVSDFDQKMKNEKNVVRANKKITTVFSDSGVVISDLSSDKQNQGEGKSK